MKYRVESIRYEHPSVIVTLGSGLIGENGGQYSAEDLVSMIRSLWPAKKRDRLRYAVFTGNLASDQLDPFLYERLHEAGFVVSLETTDQDPASDVPPPGMILLPPAPGEPSIFAVQMPPAPVKTAIVSDGKDGDDLDTMEKIHAHAEKVAWPGMVDSVNRQRLVPDGEWVLVIAPLDMDYHEIIVEDVAARIDAHIAEHPSFSVKYVALIVDSAHIQGPFRLADLN